MNIVINGQNYTFPEKTTVKEIKLKRDPYADIVIYNGAVLEDLDILCRENDQLFFIQRGRQVSKKELEFLMMSRHTPGVFQALKQGVVGVAGLGGLGSHIALALARIGVGALVLVDFDVVEPSNLNRQQYFMEQLGMYKTDALSQTIQRINPHIELILVKKKLEREDIGQVFNSCDVILEAFDRAETKTMLIKEAQAIGKIIIAASGVAGFGNNESIITRKITNNLYIVGDFESGSEPGRGLMAPRVMLAAAKQANLAVELLVEKYGKLG